jgi:hypothetical protein
MSPVPTSTKRPASGWLALKAVAIQTAANAQATAGIRFSMG